MAHPCTPSPPLYSLFHSPKHPQTLPPLSLPASHQLQRSGALSAGEQQALRRLPGAPPPLPGPQPAGPDGHGVGQHPAAAAAAAAGGHADGEGGAPEADALREARPLPAAVGGRRHGEPERRALAAVLHRLRGEPAASHMCDRPSVMARSRRVSEGQGVGLRVVASAAGLDWLHLVRACHCGYVLCEVLCVQTPSDGAPPHPLSTHTFVLSW